MDLYQQVMRYCMERAPHAIRVVYRHTDGTLRMFRYSNMEYLGECPYEFQNATDIPPELAKVVEAADREAVENQEH